MQLIPDDAERKLGFHLVRRRLETLVLTVAGRERIEALGPMVARERVEELLTQTAELQEALRTDDPLPLTAMPDTRDALRAAQPKDAVLDGEQLAQVLEVLLVLRRTHSYFNGRREAYPRISALALEIEPSDDLERHIGRIVDARGKVRDDASAELSRLKRQLMQTHGELDAALLRSLRAAAREGFAAEEQPTIRNGRAVIPVRAEAKRKVQGFVHDVSGTGQTVYIEPAAVLDLNNEVRELELAHSREVRRLLQEATGHVRARLPALRSGLEVLARLDELQARARLANELDALVPELNDQGRVCIVSGRNPALVLHFRQEAAENTREVVPLDIELSDDVRTIVITGPNAGGKSVALKTTGLFCLMASCGMPVPGAPGTTLPLFEELFVDLGDQQSIEQDLSTFTSHLVNLHRMLTRAGSGSLVLIDEAGTGTDPAEGGALAQAVLEALTARGARTVATTHHGTLKAFAHRAPGVLNASMEFDQATLAPTYVFRSGVPGSSYAFEIAGRVGLGDELLDRARDLVGEQKTALEDLIADLDARSQQLQEQLATAAEEARRAEQTRRSFEGRDLALRQREQEILSKALADAERVVTDANARIEQTIREIKEAGAQREATRAARGGLDRFRERIEEERREARRQAESLEPAAKHEDEVVSTDIREGDRVRIEDNGAIGEVLEIEGEDAVVVLGQMRLRTQLRKLRKVSGAGRSSSEVPSPRTSQAVPALEAKSRIDVRGYRVEEALPEVERLIDQAVAAGASSIEVLHGKGTGALREAVREYLRSRPEVSAIEDAAWNQGGAGVTVVLL